MSGSSNWRTPIGAGDYFLSERKRADIAARRPAIRTASDLVGPGIGAGAVRLDDFNDLLGTFNGYYSAVAGATNGPTADEPVVGYVVGDATLGGVQVFTGLESGTEYRRTFVRSSDDPESIGWGLWSGERIPASVSGQGALLTTLTSAVPNVIAPPVLNDALGAASDTYQRTDAGIQLLRTGVYVGEVQVASTSTAVETQIAFYRPNRDAVGAFVHNAVLLDSTYHIPFTCWATVSGLSFSIIATHYEGGPRDFYYRFSCTRVGDAV